MIDDIKIEIKIQLIKIIVMINDTVQCRLLGIVRFGSYLFHAIYKTYIRFGKEGDENIITTYYQEFLQKPVI